MRKIGFPLSVQDGWPPFDVEHIWVEEEGYNFRIQNFPFFVKGLAYNDLISAELDSSGYILTWRQVKPSTNSTMWIIEHVPTNLADVLSGLGCGVETGDPNELIAINVPASININMLDSILKPYEESGEISIAIPADRIGLRN